MKTVYYESFGTADKALKMGEQPLPEPAHGEVLIKLHTSGVNPSDVKKRAGSNPAVLAAGPVIPHSDGAGIIEKVGIGVPASRIGECVWTYNAQYGRQHGTCAEYVCLPSSQAVWMPEQVSFQIGACMGIPAMTAHRCVMADGEVMGKVILVTGGAGRVGHYAIQLAKLHGATVIATASSEGSKTHCLEAGADYVVGHPDAQSVAEILEITHGQKVDRIVEGEFGGNFLPLLDAIKISGTIATYASMSNPQPQLPFYRMMYLDLTIRMVVVYAMPDAAKTAAAQDITALLERNQLQHRIAHVYPLSETIQAHQKIEEGTVRGCVVVEI